MQLILVYSWYFGTVRPFEENIITHFTHECTFIYALILFTRMVGLPTPQKGDSDNPFRSELRIDYLLN
jgi:hypothetical protein